MCKMQQHMAGIKGGFATAIRKVAFIDHIKN